MHNQYKGAYDALLAGSNGANPIAAATAATAPPHITAAGQWRYPNPNPNPIPIPIPIPNPNPNPDPNPNPNPNQVRLPRACC